MPRAYSGLDDSSPSAPSVPPSMPSEFTTSFPVVAPPPLPDRPEIPIPPPVVLPPPMGDPTPKLPLSWRVTAYELTIGQLSKPTASRIYPAAFDDTLNALLDVIPSCGLTTLDVEAQAGHVLAQPRDSSPTFLQVVFSVVPVTSGNTAIRIAVRAPNLGKLQGKLPASFRQTVSSSLTASFFDDLLGRVAAVLDRKGLL